MSLYSPDSEVGSSKMIAGDFVANEINVSNLHREEIYLDSIKQSAIYSFREFLKLPIVNLNIGPRRKMKLGKKSNSNTRPIKKIYKLH